MRFLKLGRPKNIFVLLIAAAFIFILQYFTIHNIAKQSGQQSTQKDIIKELDALKAKCKEGSQKACEDYTLLLEKAVQSQ